MEKKPQEKGVVRSQNMKKQHRNKNAPIGGQSKTRSPAKRTAPCLYEKT